VRTEGNLIIVGTSARAAAFSALRAGLRPWCADFFADLDLRQQCAVIRIPTDLPRTDKRAACRYEQALQAAPPGPWMYTGGLENRPKLIRRLARHRRLWGNGPEQLRRARDPWFIHDTLRAAGLPAPQVLRDGEPPPPQRRWLRKPLHGAGGSGIHWWTSTSASVPKRGPWYVQEFIDGTPHAAVYIGDGQGARLLGLTRQLVGASFLHAGPFRYCGSIGPVEPSPALRESLERVGDVLAARCGLRGLFGIDGVLRDGDFYPVEINPRYTASVEVLEYATGLPALVWHAGVFQIKVPSTAHRPSGIVGKAILFAHGDLTFPTEGPWLEELRTPTPLTEPPSFADIPAAGERIPAGRPVLTIFARGPSAADCEDRLRQIAADLHSPQAGA
jgi:predicted ATP-grasp superfamily ATP-dependent carboligase